MEGWKTASEAVGGTAGGSGAGGEGSGSGRRAPTSAAVTERSGGRRPGFMLVHWRDWRGGCD